MPQRPARMCSKCYSTAEIGSSLCTKHKAEPDTRQRSTLKKLYDRKLWRVFTKQSVMARDPQCTEIVNGVRCMQLATDAHHIIDAQEWVALGNDFYDLDNLAGLCHAHHARHTSWRRHGRELGQ